MIDRAEPELQEIYRDLILDHYRSPRHRGRLDDPKVTVEGLNPLCGDEIRLDLDFTDSRISRVAFSGRGCSISQASASMMSEAIEGGTIAEAEELIAGFKAMMTQGAPAGPELGDLASMSGVARLPVRVKCATLAWNVLREGIDRHGSL